jgi:hypothetical protein
LCALSLFGQGELRALRVIDTRIFRIIAETLQANVPNCGGPSPTAQMMSQALDSLCAVEFLSPRWCTDQDEIHATAVIERCAATITELRGPLPAHLLCQTDGSGHPPVLARCTRLEVLTRTSQYTPAVWLGLSQLHTLHDVDLNKVSVAAIAAALPRLHTLTAHCRDPFSGRVFSGATVGGGQHRLNTDDPSGVAGFFTDLLPRLRVFHFMGKWPTAAVAKSALRTVSPPPPLPLLGELVWQEEVFSNRPLHPTVLRGLLGARPSVLSVPYELIVECLRHSPGEPTDNLLTRVCDLRIGVVGPRVDIHLSAAAQVLRAAPQLRTFAVSVFGDTSWLTASAAPIPRAFMDLVHPRLRLLTVHPRLPHFSSDEGCASRLRRTCFPRLRELAVGGETFFAASDVA